MIKTDRRNNKKNVAIFVIKKKKTFLRPGECGFPKKGIHVPSKRQLGGNDFPLGIWIPSTKMQPNEIIF
jgi:hypothetical protein